MGARGPLGLAAPSLVPVSVPPPKPPPPPPPSGGGIFQRAAAAAVAAAPKPTPEQIKASVASYFALHPTVTASPVTASHPPIAVTVPVPAPPTPGARSTQDPRTPHPFAKVTTAGPPIIATDVPPPTSLVVPPPPTGDQGFFPPVGPLVKSPGFPSDAGPGAGASSGGGGGGGGVATGGAFADDSSGSPAQVADGGGVFAEVHPSDKAATALKVGGGVVALGGLVWALKHFALGAAVRAAKGSRK